MDSLMSLSARWVFSFLKLGRAGVPSLDQFLDGADIDIAVVKKVLQGRHVLYQKPAVLADGIAAKGGCAFFAILGKE